MRPLTIILSFLMLAFVGCRKRCDLPDQQTGKGLVIGNARVAELDPTIITGEMRTTYRIDSDEQNIFNLMVTWDGGATMESIDFSNYTVLGAFATGSGCGVIYDRLVLCNEAEQKCLYRVDVIECGNCELLSESMNWVLVPKLGDNVNVHFMIH